MTEAKISRVTQIDDPTLLAFAQGIADGIMAAGFKAAAHHANPKSFKLPVGDSLEKAFLGYLRAQPLEQQTKLANKALPLVTNKQVPGFAGVDFTSARPAIDLAVERTKLGTLSKANFAKREAATLEEGALGFRKQAAPDHLQFHLLSVKCIDETDGFLGSEAGSDEIAFGGLMVDAGGATISIPRFRVGDFASDGVTKNFDPPVQFGVMDFRSGAAWPKTFALSLVLVELDNGNFPELLRKLYDEAAAKLRAAVQNAAPGGTIGEIIMAAVDWVITKVFSWLKDWWEDDLFKPITMSFDFPAADATLGANNETNPMWLEWSGHGGRYRMWFKAKLALAADASIASGAMVYEHANFAGKSALLPVGHYTLAQMRARGMDNDMISSIKTGPGMRVVAYQHEGFAGTARMYTGAVAQLGDFNDQISSIVVEPMRVMLFQHANFGGNSQAFGVGRFDVGQLTIGNDQASSVLVPPGYKVTLFSNAGFQGAKRVITGDASYVGNDFNDVVSSIIVEYV